MATFEFDVYDLSVCGLNIVRAAVKYARLNSSTDIHVIPLPHFYRLAGLAPKMSLMQFKALLWEIRHTGVFSSDFEPAVSRGWSVFEHLGVTETHLKFSVCRHAFSATEPVDLFTANGAASLQDLEMNWVSTRIETVEVGSGVTEPTCGKLLYLDFDGVLHADEVYWSPKTGI